MSTILTSRDSIPDAVDVDGVVSRLFRGKGIRRILLVTPPDADSSLFQFDTARRKRYPNYPPYGLLALAAHLRALGIEVQVCNLNHEILRSARNAEGASTFDFDAVWNRILEQHITSFAPDLVGVTCMFTMSHVSFRNVCQYVASHDVPLAVGGVHVTNDLDRIIQDLGVVDLAFCHEGDRAFPAFVEFVNGNADQDALGQMVLFDRTTGRRFEFLDERQPDSQEISVLPAYDLIDLETYSAQGPVGSFYFLKTQSTRFATVLSNRGCRARCTFCSVRTFNGEGVRARSVESVIDEFEYLRDKSGINHVMWLDDDLFYDKRRSMALFTELAKRRTGITWDATNGVLASSCSEELVAAAEESGCIGLHIGMESGNPEILRAIKKPATVEVLLRAAEVLRQHERIFSMVFLMVGFPGETLSQIWDTIRVAREMNLDWYKVSQLQPLPGTPIYESMVAQGLVGAPETGDVRYSAGSYGTQNEIDQGIRLSSANFRDAFSAIPMDAIPSGAQLDDVWFFMNYHLNFHRIFTEDRPVKIQQLLALLRNLSDVVAPEHGFALYFLAYLQREQAGAADDALMERLEQQLSTSAYWRDRLRAFGLSKDDLVTGMFAGTSNPLVSALD